MRILVLNYEFPPLGGGGGTVSKDLAVRMAKKGHIVDVVTMAFNGLPSEEVIDGIHIYRVKSYRKHISSCSPVEQLTYIVSAIKFVKDLLKKENYDICHAHFIVPTAVVAYFIKRKYGLKYVITAHGSDVEGYNSKISNLIVHKLIRKPWITIVRNSEEVIAPSDYLVRLMQKRLSHDYRVIPNGIDLDAYHFIGNGDKGHSILFVGRLQKSKNVQSVIKALSMLDMYDWIFNVVGDGPYKEDLISLTKELGLQKKIVFHGWIDNGSRRHNELYRNASLFVSESYFESFGVAVVEAVASGCDVLLSDIETHRMFVENDLCFTNPDDIYAISDRIQQYISGDISLKTDRKVIEKFSWDYVVGEYEKEYGISGNSQREKQQ